MADRAGAVMFKGNPIALGGPEIKAGSDAPDFTALDNGLQPVKLSQARGKVIVLSAVPSLDTPVCDTETRKFNAEAGKLAGLTARAVFVVGKDGKVKHAEYVKEITTEPNYDAALAAAKQAAAD